MGMDADVIVIGPLSVLAKFDALDYPVSYYEDIPLGTLILGTVAQAEATNQSHKLAGICGVEPWDLGGHQVKNPVKPVGGFDYIGEDTEMEIYKLLVDLLKYDNVQIWYRPNG